MCSYEDEELEGSDRIEKGEKVRKKYHAFLTYSEEELKTILLTLGNVAIYTDSNEAQILFLFTFIASRDASTQRLAVSILDMVAARDNFLSREELLKNYICQILSLWIIGTDTSTQRCVFDFPYEILHHSALATPNVQNKKTISVKDFLHTYIVLFLLLFIFHFSLFLQDKILPQILFIQDEEALRKISSCLAIPLTKLLKTNFSAVFAHIYPLKYCMPDTFELAWKLVNRYMSEEELDNELLRQLDEILVRLIDILVHPTDTLSRQLVPNRYDQNAISKSIRYLQQHCSEKYFGSCLLSFSFLSILILIPKGVCCSRTICGIRINFNKLFFFLMKDYCQIFDLLRSSQLYKQSHFLYT